MRIYAKLFDFNFPGRTYFWGKAFMFASTLEFFLGFQMDYLWVVLREKKYIHD